MAVVLVVTKKKNVFVTIIMYKYVSSDFISFLDDSAFVATLDRAIIFFNRI